MPNEDTKSSLDVKEGVRGGVERREPGGRAARDAAATGAPRDGLAPEVRDRLSDELIDELLAGAGRRRRSSGPGACWPI